MRGNPSAHERNFRQSDGAVVLKRVLARLCAFVLGHAQIWEPWYDRRWHNKLLDDLEMLGLDGGHGSR